MTRYKFARFGSICALLVLWWLAAVWTGDPSVLPSPAALVGPMRQEVMSGELPTHLGHTLLRVLWAFCLALVLGTGLGYVMGRNATVDSWLDSWLVVFLNLPALVLIVLCYLWIGLNETAAIAAVTLNKIPNVVTIIREGARTFEARLEDLAQVFGMSRCDRVRHIHLPQLAPYFAVAARSGLATIWKIVLVVEFLGRSNGIGFKVHLYFQQFDVPMVLVYSLSFIAVMLVVEVLLLQPWERAARRWRTA
ncbi:ABC transporter permease [Qingshengfaniella alkalisoli]|uniref:ABC transporter permease n=1 Tax=Qingshengfaniella alkalisoli TaxID=2599296 RepID=A0A5B8J4F3_9RHOB|nr:ABC transporter permease [Qingshengfaniella alkalisoli]QDY71588.1 ABC transporter permease [Qingshengfaniella alkalisoli]